MKMNKKIAIPTGFLVLVVSVSIMSLLFSSCMEKDPSLGTLPVPSFASVALTPTSDSPMNMALINTTPNPSIAFWNVSGIGSFKGDTAKVMFTYAGDYLVQLKVIAHGGIDSCTQVVTVPENNPYAINPASILGILSGASIGREQRTWKAERVVNSVVQWNNYISCLAQIDGTMNGAPWAVGSADIAQGSAWEGYFDDQYTFTLELEGKFIYDDNNTVTLEGKVPLSAWKTALPAPWNSFTGTTSSTDLFNLVPALKPWGSGNFTYSIANTGGGNFLGTITVIGLGAHMGLQDKANNSNAVTPTATSVKYDILRISTNLTDKNTGAPYDEIILGVTTQTARTVWAFMFRSDR